MEFLVRFILPISLVAVAVSDSVGGLCARAAIAAPLYWAGAIDIETANAIAAFSAY